MKDNKSIEDKRDKTRIDINDPSEVEYVHQQFPHLSHSQVADAIRQEGPSRQAVMEFLNRKQSHRRS